MFGLKIISKQDFLNLQNQLYDAKALLAENKAVISSLETEISNLKKKINALSGTTKKKTPETILLTDVAEEALKVEEKPKRRREPKTESTTKPKKSTEIVRKKRSKSGIIITE